MNPLARLRMAPHVDAPREARTLGTRWLQLGFGLGLGAWVACQPSPQPAENPSGAASTTPSETAGGTPATASAAASNDGPGAGAATASSAAAPDKKPEPAPAVESLVQLCEKGCTKLTKSCSETALENCRMNCTQYEHPPAGCEGEVRKALECARDAQDVTCVNIAPESCAQEFRRVVACASGKPLPPQEDPLKPPDGWERYVSKRGGFSAMLPKGVSETDDGGVPTFTVKEGEATYSVRILPPPKEKPTQKNLVFVAYKVVGKCNRNLKTYGLFEKSDRVFTRSDANCPDGGEYRGALVITPSKMYALSVLSPKNSKVPRDPFLYAFELTP